MEQYLAIRPILLTEPNANTVYILVKTVRPATMKTPRFNRYQLDRRATHISSSHLRRRLARVVAVCDDDTLSSDPRWENPLCPLPRYFWGPTENSIQQSFPLEKLSPLPGERVNCPDAVRPDRSGGGRMSPGTAHCRKKRMSIAWDGAWTLPALSSRKELSPTTASTTGRSQPVYLKEYEMFKGEKPFGIDDTPLTSLIYGIQGLEDYYSCDALSVECLRHMAVIDTTDAMRDLYERCTNRNWARAGWVRGVPWRLEVDASYSMGSS
ncbi:hypothetical protein QBC37DRAFT_405210 [Rhypophila decipiens]|uniref:Uncharacterized protein n=1 Tax=Rhypophila decipiens TaxID=261697 RepID=A0AAN6Y377_9PEZI|nr:hypothetical protein QBC37DRAFT_405210 [Rhypophila decipiens]